MLPNFQYLTFHYSFHISKNELPQLQIFSLLISTMVLPRFIFFSLSPPFVTSCFSSLSYFFSEFQQQHYQNLHLTSFCQISLNSTNITNKLHFLQHSAKNTRCDQTVTSFPISSVNKKIHLLSFSLSFNYVFFWSYNGVEPPCYN